MSAGGEYVPDLFSGIFNVARNPVNKSPRLEEISGADRGVKGKRGFARRPKSAVWDFAAVRNRNIKILFLSPVDFEERQLKLKTGRYLGNLDTSTDVIGTNRTKPKWYRKSA